MTNAVAAPDPSATPHAEPRAEECVGESEDAWSVVRSTRRRKRSIQPRYATSSDMHRSSPTAPPSFSYVNVRASHPPTSSDPALHLSQLHILKQRLGASAWWADLRDKLPPHEPRLDFIQCLGLGSFEASANARHQLALLLLMSELLAAARVSVCDPAMTAADTELVQHLGFSAASPRQLHIMSGNGVLYMPHCGADLNLDMLRKWAARDDEREGSLVYVGNSLRGYVDTNFSIHADLVHTVEHLIATRALNEVKCLDASKSTLATAFNSLAVVHLGPRQR